MYELVTGDIGVPTANSVTNTAAETLFGGTINWPNNNETGENAGRIFEVVAYGNLSTATVTPGSGAWKLKWGSTVLATITIASLPVSLAAMSWSFKGYIQVRTTGTSGVIYGCGELLLNGVSYIIDTAGTGTTGQTVNTETQALAGLSFTFGTASASNSIQATFVKIGEER